MKKAAALLLLYLVSFGLEAQTIAPRKRSFKRRPAVVNRAPANNFEDENVEDSPSSHAKSSRSREAKLAWKEIPGMRRYEVELSRNSKMDPVLARKDVSRSELSIRLAPGNYFFRIRAFDSDEQPGVWSPVQGFAVNDRAPQALRPSSGAVFRSLLKDGELLFRWSQGTRGSRYQLSISDDQGELVSRGVKDNEYAWKVRQAGTYSWKVGVENVQGVEWGEERQFTVEPSALPPELRSKHEAPPFSFLKFRLSGIHLRQKGNANSSSLQGSWTPTLRIGKAFDFGGQLGLTSLKESSGKNFTAIESLLFIGVEFRPFIVEVQGGFQSWMSYGSFPTLQMSVAYRLHSVADRVFFSAGRVFDDSDNSALLLKLGVGFDFDRPKRSGGRE